MQNLRNLKVAVASWIKKKKEEKHGLMDYIEREIYSLFARIKGMLRDF